MQTLSPAELTELQLKANDVRQGIIRSLLAAGSGHSAGPLDMSDVFTALYGRLMRHDPARPDVHRHHHARDIAIGCSCRAVTSHRYDIPRWPTSDIFRSRSC